MGKISFIVPMYNCEQFVASCLNNILKSAINDYEIILVDDGSTDQTGKICDEWAQENKMIKVVHQKNQGVSVARNHGLALASSDYIVFLDVDDSIETEKLSDLLELLENDSTIDMVIYGLSFDFYHSGRQYRRDELVPAITGKACSDIWLANVPALFQSNSLSPIWNKIIKRSILVKHQLELRNDMFLYEDLEFSLRCMAYCDMIYFSPDIIYHYRQAEDEGNAGRRLKRIEHLPVLIEQVKQALNKLIEQKQAEEYQTQIESILLSLYLILAREKISVSNVTEIRQICEDFKAWYAGKALDIPADQQKFAGQLLDKKVYRLVMQRNYIAVRHAIAVKIKNIVFYQKARGLIRNGY